MSRKSCKDLTDTADSSWIQLKIRRTVARVTARSVDTVATDAGGWVQTLINIYVKQMGAIIQHPVWADITKGSGT